MLVPHHSYCKKLSIALKEKYVERYVATILMKIMKNCIGMHKKQPCLKACKPEKHVIFPLLFLFDSDQLYAFSSTGELKICDQLYSISYDR